MKAFSGSKASLQSEPTKSWDCETKPTSKLLLVVIYKLAKLYFFKHQYSFLIKSFKILFEDIIDDPFAEHYMTFYIYKALTMIFV